MNKNLNLSALKPVKSMNLYKQVEVQLTSLFTNSDLKPGDKLPSERVLQEHLGVSRSVLREALRILEAKGLIEGKQGKGRFIRSDLTIYTKDISFSELEKITLNEFYEMRLILEPTIAQWAAQRATKEDIEILVTTLKEMEVKDHPEDADFPFHMALAHASHNRMAIRTMQEHFEIQMLYSNQLFEKVQVEYPWEKWKLDHEQILSAVINHDPELAKQTMLNHLKKSFEIIRQT